MISTLRTLRIRGTGVDGNAQFFKAVVVQSRALVADKDGFGVEDVRQAGQGNAQICQKLFGNRGKLHCVKQLQKLRPCAAMRVAQNVGHAGIQFQTAAVPAGAEGAVAVDGYVADGAVVAAAALKQLAIEDDPGADAGADPHIDKAAKGALGPVIMLGERGGLHVVDHIHRQGEGGGKAPRRCSSRQCRKSWWWR